ncbi:hypothetical protein [Allorhodopirellula solitaria]|uniref:Secreted protein n=1 Tax=Allorhodopirellula solitaria TaxID=2527987 RepID=A0A5C5X168_9BACT|nr:hypothetical protein [Allorhodopirellula solitaria]TWT56041.1 hypothetical protein CA85_46330 [Allorhodopirellula solitaria]
MNIHKHTAITLLLLAGLSCFAATTPGCSSSSENVVAPPAEPDSPEVAKEKAAHYGGKASKPSG